MSSKECVLSETEASSVAVAFDSRVCRLCYRKHRKNKGRPQGVGNHEKKYIPPPKVQGAPERPCYEGCQGKDQVAGEDVYGGVDDCGGHISADVTPFVHKVFLQEAPPENLFTGTGDEEEKQENEDPVAARAEGVYSSHGIPGMRHDIGGEGVSHKEDDVQSQGGKGAEQKGLKAHINGWALAEK